MDPRILNLLNQIIEKNEKDEEINKLKSRRLTWKERFSGKIIHNNEDKRV